MKLLAILLLSPFFAFSQLTPKDSIALSGVLSQASGLSEYDYKLASKSASELLAKYPNDSLVLLTQVRLFDMYVNKSKCQNYLVPKNTDVCTKALSFYDLVDDKIKYPRLSIAKGMVYYYLAKKGDKTAKTKATQYFNEAIANGKLADFEKREIDLFILRLE